MGGASRLVRGVLLAALAATMGCTSSSGPASTQSISTASTSSSTKPGVPPRTGAADRVVVRGDALLDGKPFDSRFVGAVVLEAGFVTPCQVTLPPVANGRYTI